MDSFARNLSVLDAAMCVAAVAALLAAIGSGSALALVAMMRDRTPRMGFVVFAAAFEILCALVVPFAAWSSVHETALRFGAENMQPLFAMPAVRAIAILATALAVANIAGVVLLVRPAERGPH